MPQNVMQHSIAQLYNTGRPLPEVNCDSDDVEVMLPDAMLSQGVDFGGSGVSVFRPTPPCPSPPPGGEPSLGP